MLNSNKAVGVFKYTDMYFPIKDAVYLEMLNSNKAVGFSSTQICTFL